MSNQVPRLDDTRLSFIEFQTPAASETPPTGAGWVHEIKFDGYRTQVIVEPERARAYSKSGLNWSDKYWPITLAARNLPCKTAILDGEVIVNNEKGISDFHALARAIRKSPGKLVFVAFDLLHLDGEDLRSLPLLERKAKLRTLLDGSHDCIQYSEHFEEEGTVFFNACDRLGLEGIISKRADSRYRSGPSKSWLKTKCYAFGEFDVLGVETTRTGEPVALLASKESGRYAGSAFVTLKRSDRERFWRNIEKLKTSQAATPISRIRSNRIQWVRPGLTASVRYLKGEEKLRHASLTGINSEDPDET